MQPKGGRLSSFDTKGLLFLKGQLASNTKIMLLCQSNGTELISLFLQFLPSCSARSCGCNSPCKREYACLDDSTALIGLLSLPRFQLRNRTKSMILTAKGSGLQMAKRHNSIESAEYRMSVAYSRVCTVGREEGTSTP